MKAKSLHGLEVSNRTGLVGDLVRKSAAYDVWALEPAVDRTQGSGSGGEDQGEAKGTVARAHAGLVGAEELNNLSVLLPCKRRGGKLQLGACGPVFTCQNALRSKPPHPRRTSLSFLIAVYSFSCGCSSEAHHTTPCRRVTPRKALGIGYCPEV